MKTGAWLVFLLGGTVWGALVATPELPLPGGDKLGLSGSAWAQEYIEIDYFYDELEPYGQWVWHPRFGYVWLPETVSPYWRPYTVGQWVSTDEYGWYWNSYEPFAWAVYHYGRWGYDPDYGWFWVPGDTWAPAWVQWRYSDEYVGWAPIGPGIHGYAYGMPTAYDPPIAESWVFVQPRYMTSRDVSHYAVPVAGLRIVFRGATQVYRPQFRGGAVYNYGIPRDRVVHITKRPIVVQKIHKFDRKGGEFDEGDGRRRGINIYAPGLAKGDKPRRGPRKFADHPNEFKPKAKLKETFKGEPPKGWGPSAKGLTPIAKEAGPDAFKRKQGRFDAPADYPAYNKQGKGGQGKPKGPGGPGGPRPWPDDGQANIQGGPDGPSGQRGRKGKFGPGGPGGPSQPWPDDGQANIQGGPDGPGRKGKFGPGGPGGPGSSGQGQGEVQGGESGPGRDRKGRGNLAICNDHPDLPMCEKHY